MLGEGLVGRFESRVLGGRFWEVDFGRKVLGEGLRGRFLRKVFNMEG